MIKRLKILQQERADINWLLSIRNLKAEVRTAKIFFKCPCCVARVFGSYMDLSEKELQLRLPAIAEEINGIHDQISLQDLKDVL